MSWLQTAMINAEKAWRAANPAGILLRDQKIIYFPVPKAGNSSIRLALAELAELQVGSLMHKIPFETIRASRVDITGEHRSFRVFTVIRNPWSRIVSCYKDKICQQGSQGGAFSATEVHSGFERYNRLLKRKLFRREMSFLEFVSVVAKIPDCLSDEHFRSQHCLYTDRLGRCRVKNIFMLERLPADLPAFLPELAIPEVNRTEKSDFRDFYRQYPAAVELVAARYRRDILDAGYEPPAST